MKILAAGKGKITDERSVSVGVAQQTIAHLSHGERCRVILGEFDVIVHKTSDLGDGGSHVVFC